MNKWQTKVEVDDLAEDSRFHILQLLLDHLNLEIIQEATPDYLNYELRAKKCSTSVKK